MEAIGAGASVIAIVQAGGMLMKAGAAFYDTFLKKDGARLQIKDSNMWIENLADFIEGIERFRTTQAQYGLSQSKLDVVLGTCKAQLLSLKRDVAEFGLLDVNASKWRTWRQRFKERMDQSELQRIESTIRTVLHQLSLYVGMVTSQLSLQSDEVTRGLIRDVLTHQVQLNKAQEEQRASMDGFQENLQEILRRLKTMNISSTTSFTYAQSISSGASTEVAAPARIFPRFNFPADTAGHKAPKSVLDRTREWLDLPSSGNGPPVLCITGAHCGSLQRVCVRIIGATVGHGIQLGYNGLAERYAAEPAIAEIGTIGHAIWCLTNQLIFQAHSLSDAIAPGDATDASLLLESLRQVGNQNEDMTTVYVVLYMISRTCRPGSSYLEDRTVCNSLVKGLLSLCEQSNVRMVFVTDDPDDIMLNSAANVTTVHYDETESDGVALDDWIKYDNADCEEEEPTVCSGERYAHVDVGNMSTLELLDHWLMEHEEDEWSETTDKRQTYFARLDERARLFQSIRAKEQEEI